MELKDERYWAWMELMDSVNRAIQASVKRQEDELRELGLLHLAQQMADDFETSLDLTWTPVAGKVRTDRPYISPESLWDRQ